MKGEYGKITVEGVVGSSLFHTIEQAKSDFGNMPIQNVAVLFNESLNVPVKTAGVVINLPDEIWKGFFDRESAETGVGRLTVEQMNKELSEYAYQYAANNEKESTGKSL